MNAIFEFLVLISSSTLMSHPFYPHKSKSCCRETYTVLLCDQDKITTVEPLFRGPSRDQGNCPLNRSVP